MLFYILQDPLQRRQQSLSKRCFIATAAKCWDGHAKSSDVQRKLCNLVAACAQSHHTTEVADWSHTHKTTHTAWSAEMQEFRKDITTRMSEQES